MGEDSRSLPLSSCSLDQYNSIQCTTCNKLNTSAVYSLVISAHCCIWLTLPVNVRNLTEALVHSVCVGCGQTSNMALLFVMASTSVLCSLSFCSISSLNDDISLHTHTHTHTDFDDRNCNCLHTIRVWLLLLEEQRQISATHEPTLRPAQPTL